MGDEFNERRVVEEEAPDLWNIAGNIGPQTHIGGHLDCGPAIGCGVALARLRNGAQEGKFSDRSAESCTGDRILESDADVRSERWRGKVRPRIEKESAADGAFTARVTADEPDAIPTGFGRTEGYVGAERKNARWE